MYVSVGGGVLCCLCGFLGRMIPTRVGVTDRASLLFVSFVRVGAEEVNHAPSLLPAPMRGQAAALELCCSCIDSWTERGRSASHGHAHTGDTGLAVRAPSNKVPLSLPAAPPRPPAPRPPGPAHSPSSSFSSLPAAG